MILSLGKIKGVNIDDGYDGLHNNPLKLYHLDGLHRMLGYYKQSNNNKVRAYIAW